MLLVDSHCHLDGLDYQSLHKDVSDVLEKAKSREVGFILAVATTLPGFRAMTEQIGMRDNVAFSCGVHPLNQDEPYDYAELRQLAASSLVVAMGETGLDYYYQQETKAQQQASFREHIRIGNDLHKPVIVHTRAAREDTLAILKEEQAEKCGGVLHCFTEDLATARTLLDMGFYISFSGIITFRTAEALREVARYVPLERMLIETDSPWLAPVPYRGQENQPAYVRDVAEYLAVLKGTTLETLAAVTTDNFYRLFHIDPARLTITR
ncbi:TatD DNase family protein|uniref:TatD DNase family protein n=1 Tax=Brenneria salicis ATCC 15712 = DSM 30166 TaxID=714314 RepID=A0A366I0F3_9GAMM|nr:metal-dependent hydrolase [Brenneria salicis]NMN91249.1 TatD DNase family protein [Brenneria salicis ATCC 15712 = DSM 30166]RBP60420.1 TatD DNase family protein [Brenneria salicis ATCC 15712 = DSM 30166]RLM30051.1 metal-dependent hydrolase [Brenneria salicis ATCC 15712 = DSM 30166]